GSYLVRANLNANGKNYSGSAPVEVGGRNIENLNVVIGPGAVITGHLRVEGNSNESLSNVQIRLMPREQGVMMFSPGLGKLNEDGSFRIEDVTADVYNLTLFGLPDGFYIKSIRSGETDALPNGVDGTGPVAP